MLLTILLDFSIDLGPAETSTILHIFPGFEPLFKRTKLQAMSLSGTLFFLAQ
jgi:hypothetical protein